VAKASEPRLNEGKLNPSSPWIRCIIGSIVASPRPTLPVRRGSIDRTMVLLKGRLSPPWRAHDE